MTALLQSINRDFYNGVLETYPVAAESKIYKGSAVGENGSGYARALVAGDKFLGFSEEEIDNTGSNGAKKVLLKRKGTVSLPVTSLAITDNDGVAVFASDDNTFTKTASGNSLIGHVRRYESSGVGIVEYDANLSVVSQNQAVANAAFTIGTEGSNAINVGIQLKDIFGNDLASRGAVNSYLSSDANGDVIEAASGTLSVAGGTDGVLSELNTDNTFLLVSEADGDIDVVITETSGANTFYLVLIMPDGRLVVSSAITFA